MKLASLGCPSCLPPARCRVRRRARASVEPMAEWHGRCSAGAVVQRAGQRRRTAARAARRASGTVGGGAASGRRTIGRNRRRRGGRRIGGARWNERGSAGRAGAGGGAGGTGGRKSCQGDVDCQGFKCCGGFCVNPGNDILNCGTCGNTCSGDHPYCADGMLREWLAVHARRRDLQRRLDLLRRKCCTGTQICCTVTLGPIGHGVLRAGQRDMPDRLRGLRLRRADDADRDARRRSTDRRSEGRRSRLQHRSRIAGRRPDQVGASAARHRESPRRRAEARPRRDVEDQPAPSDGGRSPFCRPRAGDLVDGVRVIGARLVDYDQPFTYDILPDSDSGTYFAGGTLIGSTLSHRFGQLSTARRPRRNGSARQPAPRAER